MKIFIRDVSGSMAGKFGEKEYKKFERQVRKSVGGILVDFDDNIKTYRITKNFVLPTPSLGGSDVEKVLKYIRELSGKNKLMVITIFTDGQI